MSGSYAEEYGAGGPDDDGVAAQAWAMAGRLDSARETYAKESREKRTGPVLKALLAALNGPAGR